MIDRKRPGREFTDPDGRLHPPSSVAAEGFGPASTHPAPLQGKRPRHLASSRLTAGFCKSQRTGEAGTGGNSGSRFFGNGKARGLRVRWGVVVAYVIATGIGHVVSRYVDRGGWYTMLVVVCMWVVVFVMVSEHDEERKSSQGRVE